MMFTPYGNGMSGYGYGLGATALVQGKDFKCVDKSGKPLPICFGVGQANHELFQQLQQAINRLASTASFKPLVVDGFIGPATVTALAQILPVAGLGAGEQSKESIAASAPTLLTSLAALAAQQQKAGQPLSPPGAPVQPTPAAAVAIATGAPPPVIPVAASASGAAPKSSLGWWIAGGVAAVLLVGVGGYVVYRRKSPQARAARF